VLEWSASTHCLHAATWMHTVPWYFRKKIGKPATAVFEATTENKSLVLSICLAG